MEVLREPIEKVSIERAATPSIISNEGFSDKAYFDTMGKSTIGYGFNMSDPVIAKFVHPDVKSGKRTMTREEANSILTTKVMPMVANDARNFVGSKLFDSLSPASKQVLLDMSYNMGGPRLNGFKNMRAALQKGDFVTAAQELMASDYGRNKFTRARALRNAKLMLKGVFDE